MITFLQAVNRVMVKLRESELTDLTSPNRYGTLIQLLVNEAKEEVEEAWDWNYQRTTIDVTTVAGTDEYSLTGAGSEPSIELAVSVTNNSVIQGPYYNANIDFTTTISSVGDDSSALTGFDLVGIDTSGDVKVRITPTPSDVQTLRFFCRVKQAYLDSSSGAIYIKAPWRPIVHLAYAKAISERGEDGGNLFDETMQAYKDSLASAISRDEKLGHRNTTWFPA